MALLVRDPTGAEYAHTEQELQERILAIYGTKESEDDMFRPDLADQHKVGFFSLDRPSQTDVSEIVDLKEMTEVLQILLQDVATLRRDINFAKHVMQADYESKLQEKSLELYCRINERVSELEKMHDDRISTVRRAFRQQLSDAIARVAVLYNKNLQRKVKQEKTKHTGDAGKMEEKLKELQMTIQRNESIIHMLKMQISQLQNKEASVADSKRFFWETDEETELSTETEKSTSTSWDWEDSERPSNVSPPYSPDRSGVPSERPSPVTPQTPSFESAPTTLTATTHVQEVRPAGIQVAMKTPTHHKAVQIDDSLQSKTPSVNHEAEELKDELNSVTQKVNLLQESLQLKDEENEQLNKDIENLNEEMTREKLEMEKIKMENNSLRAAMEQDKASSQRLNQGIQRQKEEMERMMEEKLRQAKEQSSAAAEAEVKAKQAAEREKMKFMMDQKKLLEDQLAKERLKNADMLKGDTDIGRLRKNEQLLKEEIARLKKEIEKIHRTWEKKFAILQQSLHALKDESYIRQTLQRQAAALHHAAVSYSADTPVGIMPSSKHTSPTKRPLPEIPKFVKGMPSNPTPQAVNEKDFISYTVSAPSGRGTTLFSADENQIMSENDREDIPNDIIPLPERPPRKTPSRCSNDSRPASKERARVVVVPHVPAH